MISKLMFSVLDASFIKCKLSDWENINNFQIRITGSLPFMARNIKEMFELNKKCEISFENPKIQALSSPGNFENLNFP